MSAKPRITKLLVIRLGAMGDLLHASAAIAEVARAMTGLEVHVLTSPMFAPMVSGFEGVSRVWTFEKGASLWESWRRLTGLATDLRHVGIDGMVVLQPTLKWWLLTRMVLGSAGGKRISTYAKQKVRVSPVAARHLTGRRHAVTDFYEPFRRLFDLPAKFEADLIPNLPAVNFPEKADSTASWGEKRRIGMILGVGKRRSNRAWPVDAYADLIRRLGEERTPCEVFLVGGPDEQPLAQSLLKSLAPVLPDISETIVLHDHCGAGTIPETLQLLRTCHVVVGGDTGPLHLAAAVGAPVIGLYGPTAVQRTGSIGKGALQVLVPPEDLTCWPCEAATCRLSASESLACMKAITPEQVQIQINRLCQPQGKRISS